MSPPLRVSLAKFATRTEITYSLGLSVLAGTSTRVARLRTLAALADSHRSTLFPSAACVCASRSPLAVRS